LVSDIDEVFQGLDPYVFNDFDGDGIADLKDAYPLDGNKIGDLDFDGIDDLWELQFYEGDADPSSDNDNDGLTNLAEYLSGTIDTEFNERLIISTLAEAMRPNQATKVLITLTSSSSNSNLNGLGLRIHFRDSDFDLFMVSASDAYLPGLFEINNVWQVDRDNLDGNFHTNRYIEVIWQDASSNWPSTLLPVDLLTLTVSPKVPFKGNQDAVIDFSSGRLPTGYGLDADEVTLAVKGGRMLDLDDDGRLDPLTDGLIILRALFGYDNVSAGAVSIDSPIAGDDTEIKALFESRKPLFDVDGDGEVLPLNDGLMILRFMFGYRGDDLINGSVGANASRSTANEILTYFETLNGM